MRNFMMVAYIIVLTLTIIFAAVELGLAADLTWHFDRSVFGYRSTIRARTRYLVFCSSWTILAGILLAMVVTMADTVGGSMTQVVVMFISMCFWLLGAALFTSAIGGSGLNCSGGPPFCNIVNTTLAFAWINWSFVFIAFIMALWLAFFGRRREPKPNPRGQMGTAGAPPVSGAAGTSGTNGQVPSTQQQSA